MNETLTPDWMLFTRQFPQFMKTYRKLAQKTWFKEKGWTAFIAHYREGIFMQIYKLHWYNLEHEGIHLELALNDRLLRNNQANLQLHITHRNLLPDRDRFHVETKPAMQDLIEKLGDPFSFLETPSTRINATFGYTATTFAEKAAKHIEALHPVGDMIDQALFQLFKVAPRQA